MRVACHFDVGIPSVLAHHLFLDGTYSSLVQILWASVSSAASISQCDTDSTKETDPCVCSLYILAEKEWGNDE
jgi:hypothetical protein